MKGSVFKVGDSWMYQFDVGKDENGKRIRQSCRFDTKDEAEYQLQLAIHRYMEAKGKMKRQKLVLEKTVNDTYRGIFLNNHGRLIYIELSQYKSFWCVDECFYIDRNRGRTGDARKASVPIKQTTKIIDKTDNALMAVLAKEVDKLFYGVEYTENEDTVYMTVEDYINYYDLQNDKYYFLIFVGEGGIADDKLMTTLKTRFKNKIHRSIYVELEYAGNGKGIVKECYFYDKAFVRNGRKVTPPNLHSIYIDFNRDAIIKFFNTELDGFFTDIIVISDGTVDVDNKTVPLCGSL